MGNLKQFVAAILLAAGFATSGTLACDLKVESAWIREAPAAATALAGYAVLSNTGKSALSIASASSAAFAKVELHETMIENGMAKMRAIDKLDIAPGAKVEFAPGGKHFMLINPRQGLRSGDDVAVKIKDAAGCETTVQFKVGKAAATAGAMNHSQMDHSKMDHSKMDHSNMKMDGMKMDGMKMSSSSSQSSTEHQH